VTTDVNVPARTVAIDTLRTCLVRCHERIGFPPTDAHLIAETLLDSELRGYDDHGVIMLGNHAEWVRSGAIDPAPTLTVVRQTPVTALLDGGRASGVVASTRAMDLALEKAAAHGLACVGVRNAGHFVAAAPYVERAARAGFIAFACANTTALMAPPGSATRVFGTNPLAYGFPSGSHDPLVFDMATSAIAGGKLRIAALEGRAVAPGLLLDPAGNPSTDPSDYLRGGPVLPLGGEAAHKGFGLAMVVDALAGVLLGTGFALTAGVAKDGEGKLFIALDPETFLLRAEFLARMDEQIQQVKAASQLAGGETLYPGERSQRRRRELLATGVTSLGSPAWDALSKTCAAYSVAPPPRLA